MSIGNGPANNVRDLIYTVPTLRCLNLSHDFSASTVRATQKSMHPHCICLTRLTHTLERGAPVHPRTQESISFIETNGSSPLMLHIFVRPLVIIINPPFLNPCFCFPTDVPCIPFKINEKSSLAGKLSMIYGISDMQKGVLKPEETR